MSDRRLFRNYHATLAPSDFCNRPVTWPRISSGTGNPCHYHTTLLYVPYTLLIMQTTPI